MNPRKTTIAILAALSVSLALAENFKTVNGKGYKNATVTRLEADGITVRTAGGISKIYFVELPKEVADKWLAPMRAAERAAEENRIKEQQAAEEKRAAAERERAETDKVADVPLKQSLEKFQAAEQRASQAYQSAAKGALYGQVFVSSGGGQSFKLGAVRVGLFTRDAIDVLLSALKRYADFKIQELSPSVDTAKAASDQADAAGYFSEAASKARDDYEKIRDGRDLYYSGSFYFNYLGSRVQAVETDADGKFIMNVPRRGSFVIAAQAERYITEINGKAITEHYYWLQPVSLDGQQQLTQNLSNNNLTSTTGTSSLIHTKD